MKNDDSVLVQAVLAGDENAFARLVRKYQKQVHTLAWRKVGDFHIAEDITQEIFLQVYQKLESLADPARFRGWLYVITDRHCIAWLRKNRMQTEPLDDAHLSEAETEAYSRYIATERAKTIGEARRALVEELLSKLKEGNRIAMTLHYLEGMTYAEISNRLGIAVNTVKSRLRRGRQQLKQYEFMMIEALDIPRGAEHRDQEYVEGDFGMKLTFQRDELLYPLQVLQRVTSGQRSSAIPSNVHIHAEGNTIECMAVDMEDMDIGIRMKVEGTVKQEGTIVISAEKLENIVKAWPAEKPIDFTTTKDRVEITGAADVCKIVELADEELPRFASVAEGAFAIDGETLRSVLYKTEFAAPTEKVRHRSLNGIYFNLFEDRTEVVGCDSKQLAIAQCEPFTLPEDTGGFIVPLKAIKGIEHTFSDSPEVRISRVANHILFADERATLTTRVVDAEYPKYERLMPECPEVRTVVRKEPILHATRQMAALSDPKCPALRLEIDEQQIRMSPRSPELQETHETVAVESSTGSIRIGLDARLLIGALTHLETESLLLEFSSELGPVLVKPIGDEAHLCLIMPMSLNWERSR